MAKKNNVLAIYFRFSVLLAMLSCSMLIGQQKSRDDGGRERFLMDQGWRFAFGHACDPQKDFRNGTGFFSYFAKAGYGDGAAALNFDDRSWRILNLPHDWAVELPFDSTASYSHGYKAVGRNFPETSIGWYRKKFIIPEADSGRRITIQFDGVFRNSIVWLNGFYLGEEHSGYAGFQYDITDYINYGGENVVAVRVDASMEEGWFYEGAGIYRHVWLNKTSPLHIAPDGIFVSSVVGEKTADIGVSTTIANDGTTGARFNIEQTIIDTDGKEVARGSLKHLVVKSGGCDEYHCTMKILHPTLWSIESPNLYRLISIVQSADRSVDRMETAFGVRTLRLDSQRGFFLNGRHVLLRGTNNHQDHAGVGAAIPDALQEFRIKRLKGMGANAYRCSHNPPTPELLDACDRLGMLVIDENRLMGTNAEHRDLLKRMIFRDRNHPSVFLWSIGNEEWAIEGNATGARIASTMQAYAQRLDSTRRTIAALSGWGRGISAAIDVMGFNYIFNGDIDKQHAEFPNKPSMGTEETTSRGTRGTYEDDTVAAHREATDRKPSGTSIEEGLKFYAARPFLAGLFFWTGFDYRGEPSPYGWPQVTSQSGIVDLCGFPKDMYYYLKSSWTESPVLHIFPHWNWKEGQTINVWAYSNCDEVELFLNGKSLGRKKMLPNSHSAWTVNFEPGILLARGYTGNKESITDQVETAGAPAAIDLTADRSAIEADGEDVSVVTVAVHDAKGRIVPAADNEITFSVDGPGKIIGVGNGDPSSHERDNYSEHISQVRIENLKTRTMFPKEKYPETGMEYNDSTWKSAVNGKGEYTPGRSDTVSVSVIRGEFILPAITQESKISLWPKSLGEEQTVYINGHLLVKNIKRDDAVQEYMLDHSIIHKGKNIYAIVGTPLVKRFQWDDLNTDPGIIQVSLPAETWKRHVFNGLAQIIVQSSKEPGCIVLKAVSNGLDSDGIQIYSRKSVVRPSIP